MSAKYSLATASELFKIKYGKLSDNVYNSANVLLGRIKKSNDFTGKKFTRPVPMSFSGGVGSGSLPQSNTADYGDAEFTAKKMYATCEIDRESIKAAENDEGAFVRMTKHAVSKTVESFVRNLSRALYNDGTGSLGEISANATGTASAPVIVITSASFKEANWEEKDFVNCGTDSSLFEVIEVAPATRTITLSRVSGSLDLTSAGNGLTVYMQGSKDNDIQGFKGILSATSGSLYGIPVARRWKATQLDAASAGVSTDLMNQMMLNIEKACGKVPNLIVTSYTQYRKLLNQLEDKKQYSIDPRSPELKGKLSFKGISFMSTMGEVGVFADRFIEDDRMIFLNDNYMELVHRPGGAQWFEDDGTIFLRSPNNEDSYRATYGAYLEFYCPPSFHGVLSGLST